MNRTKPPCYSLIKPETQRLALVADSPHSGSVLPDDFHFVCSLADLRQSEDSYVDQFAGALPDLGGVFLKALISRAYIDLNRAIGDLHPAVCAEPIPWPVHRSKRVMYGIGLIRHLIRPHEPVYAEPLPLAAIQARIDDYYHPYYAALETALLETRAQFGRVLHLNLHSTPNIGFDGGAQPDIILGDHDGHSCARIYRETVKRYFESCGLKVVVNNPYKGVELTRRFARPRQGIHAMQIEVNKALYMDEDTLALHEGMDDMTAVFDGLWRHLADVLGTQDGAAEMPRAAE